MIKLDNVKIVQHAPPLTEQSAQLYSNLIVLVPLAKTLPTKIPHRGVLQRRIRERGFKFEPGQFFVTDLPNDAGTRIVVASIDADKSAFALLTLARKLVASFTDLAQLAIASIELDATDARRGCEAVIAAALAQAFALPNFRSKKEARAKLAAVHCYAPHVADSYARTLAEAKGNNLARYFTALPANLLTPRLYRGHIEKLAQSYDWDLQFIDMKKLRARGAGAFLAVAQGSPDADAGIVRLRYTPKKKKSKRAALALVGKGICYDTGGTNLKTAKGMYGMHEDMEGSAVALGTLLALTELRVDFPIECWLALAQNHIGPLAYKPNDVITAANGTTIEIVHTDAEGRMVLADTLFFAAREKPALIVDYATLTGACVQALGTRYSGATANRPALVEKIIAAGAASGERVWPFPLARDYADDLKSDIADIKQCTSGSEADQILAPLFLQRFVDDTIAWIHIDLAAGNHKGGLAHIPTDVTGFGVRFTLNLLFEQKILEA